MNKTGFIFDLDGVIVDTAKYHFMAWKKLADQLGIAFSETDNERFKGVSRKRCLEILLEMGNVKATQEEFDGWMIEKNEDYLNYIGTMNESEILPGVTVILAFLKERKFPVALGSASKNAQTILEKVKLLSYFDLIVDGNNVSKAKPDPEVFLMAAKGLSVAPENCVVFEDAIAGIEAANNAGMMSVGIGDANILSNAHHNFKNFIEINLEVIKEIASI